jgi:Flp pilus assembly protein TadD
MRSERFCGILISGLIFLLVAGDVQAQLKTNITGTGGIHEIRGRIYAPNGTMLDSSITISLESTTYPTLTLVTDVSASYSFRNLAPGNYTVVVEAGDQFESSREPVLIDSEIQGPSKMTVRTKVFTVPIYLQLKRSSGPRSENRVINAKWSAIPKEAVRHFEKGESPALNKQLDKAEAEFRKSIDLAPTYAPAYTALGKLFLTQGKVVDAIAELELAVRYDASDFDARFTYGVALMNNQAMDRAQKELSEAATLDKTAVSPRYYLGLIFIQKKNLDDAQKELETAKGLVGKKTFPMLHRALGGVYVMKGMDKEGVAELEIYIGQDPAAKDADRIKLTIANLKSKIRE